MKISCCTANAFDEKVKVELFATTLCMPGKV